MIPTDAAVGGVLFAAGTIVCALIRGSGAKAEQDLQDDNNPLNKLTVSFLKRK